MSNPADSTSRHPRAKHPWLATFLSLLLPGLGQIYCGQDNKGVFLVGISLLGQWSTGGLSSWILCPAIAVDALMIARQINNGIVVRRWDFFPGIRPLNSLPVRFWLLALVLLVAALTVVHILLFTADYTPPDK